MFQPLLDAYIESAQIEETTWTTYKPPLNVALANWWSLKNSEKKKDSETSFCMSS
ncbi:hypothetical protein CHC162_04690 [Helicobacter pylori]